MLLARGLFLREPLHGRGIGRGFVFDRHFLAGFVELDDERASEERLLVAEGVRKARLFDGESVGVEHELPRLGCGLELHDRFAAQNAPLEIDFEIERDVPHGRLVGTGEGMDVSHAGSICEWPVTTRADPN